jgi:uncharacterized protein with HEPN domain
LMARDPRIALDDMIVAMDRIAEETGTLSFEQFAENWRSPSTSSNAHS